MRRQHKQQESHAESHLISPLREQHPQLKQSEYQKLH